MTQFFHIVQVHPIVGGHLNDHKVLEEREFESPFEAHSWVEIRNTRAQQNKEALLAVYVGCVNDETGELV